MSCRPASTAHAAKNFCNWCVRTRRLAGNPLDNAFSWTFRTTDAPFEETWSITFSAVEWTGNPATEKADANNTTAVDANNIAAVKYGTLDAEDEQDARAVPSFGQLSFSFLNSDKVKFDRDIRPADGRLSHHWFFVIGNPKNGSNVTIKYQPSLKLTRSTRQYQVLRLVEFDADGKVTKTKTLDPTQAELDPNTGKFKPLEAYTYTPANGETARYFRLDVQKASFVATNFEKGSTGWKFLSVPITPQRADPFVNLGDDIEPFKLYKYDTKMGGYKIYPLDIGEVSLQAGYSYFTRLEKDVEVDVGGSSNQDAKTILLKDAGWHAIGNPFIKEVKVQDIQVKLGNDTKSFSDAVTAGWIEGTLYRWKVDKNGTDAYEAVDSSGQLALWEGYWLKTKQAELTLIIPVPAGLPTELPLPPSYNPPMAPSNYELRITNYELKKGEFNLPLELKSEFASDLTTTLGTRQNAKISLDIFDASNPPFLDGTVDAYFEHLDWEGESGSYNRDYQSPMEVGEARTWQLAIYTDKPDSQMTLSWENAIEQMPADTMFYIRRLEDNRNSWQDMRQMQFVNVNAHSQFTKILFEIRAERFKMSLPEDISVIAGEKQVTIKWAANDNPFITGYTIFHSVAHDSILAPGDNLQLAPSKHLESNVNQFIDTDVEEEATYTYQVSVHFKTGAELKSELFTVTVLPFIKNTRLLQSYPNPFNPDTWIPYELKKETRVTIDIYNVNGHLMRTLDIGVQSRGRYISKDKAAHWDGRLEFGERAASGVYFYVMRTKNFFATRKMVILK